MAPSPRPRRLFAITMVCLSALWTNADADKLSPGQKAPAFARASGGRALLPPSSGQTPANVGKLGSSKPQPGPQPAQPGQTSPVRLEDAQREESVSFKEVNGESVRVVVGNYGYESPEGLPVSVKYMADENGSHASFSIGTPGAGSGKPGTRGPGPVTGPVGKGGSGQDSTGSGALGGTGKPKGDQRSGGLPGNEDRKYLPPVN